MVRNILCFLMFTSVVFTSCKKDKDENLELNEPTVFSWEKHIPFITSYQIFSMYYTDDFEVTPADKGAVAMKEASGIAYSRNNPGKIWAHNDKGNAATLFLIDTADGSIVAKYNISGLSMVDWEDIEIANGPVDGVPYLYISDTGDNDQKRKSYTIYRFQEPIFLSEHNTSNAVELKEVQIDKITFTYPDGSHDTEALFVDPFTKDIFLATKRDVTSQLYVLPYPQPVNQSYSIIKVGSFSFRETSAGTVSEDGNRIMIKNRQDIFYWQRDEGESLVQTLARTPIKAPYAGEPQGEAICFDEFNNYYTLSEEVNRINPPKLYKYYLIP